MTLNHIKTQFKSNKFRTLMQRMSECMYSSTFSETVINSCIVTEGCQLLCVRAGGRAARPAVTLSCVTLRAFPLPPWSPNIRKNALIYAPGFFSCDVSSHASHKNTRAYRHTCPAVTKNTVIYAPTCFLSDAWRAFSWARCVTNVTKNARGYRHTIVAQTKNVLIYAPTFFISDPLAR